MRLDLVMNLIILSIFSSNLLAQANNKSGAKKDTQNKVSFKNSLMRIQSELNCEGKDCQMIRKHLSTDKIKLKELTGNEKKCLYPPSDIKETLETGSLSNLNQEIIKVRGNITYARFMRGRYGYDAYQEDGKLIIESRIYFKNEETLEEQSQAPEDNQSIALSKPDEILEFQYKSVQKRLTTAANYWSKNNPYNTPIEFRFFITRSKEDAHLKTTLHLDPKWTKARGPYFWNWNYKWNHNIITHEMGHVLGLNDEYSHNPFGSTFKPCNKPSLMCAGDKFQFPDMKKYMYYMILRRLKCIQDRS